MKTRYYIAGKILVPFILFFLRLSYVCRDISDKLSILITPPDERVATGRYIRWDI